MDSPSELAINMAIARCVEHCLLSNHPSIYLSDYLDTLRELGWSEQTVETVAHRVRARFLELRSGLPNCRCHPSRMTGHDNRFYESVDSSHSRTRIRSVASTIWRSARYTPCATGLSE